MQGYCKVLLIFIALKSSSVLAKFCENDPSDHTDGVNLSLDVSSLTSGRHLSGNNLNTTARVSWSHPSKIGTSLHGMLSIDGTVMLSSHSQGSAYAWLFENNKSDWDRGAHQITISSQSATDCSLSVGFISQNAPSAQSTPNLTYVLAASSSDTVVGVNLNGNYTTDEDYSIAGHQPILSWTVNGQVFNGSDVEVNLPQGKYNALFRVNDGVFEANSTTVINIIDELSVKDLNVETWCNQYTARTQLTWSPTVSTDFYEVQFQPQYGSWSATTQRSIPSIMTAQTNYNPKSESARIRACNTVRCSPYSQITYIVPGCINGGGAPN